MFASQESFRRNPKLHFFNDKELLAKGNKSERLVSQFLELSVNPTAVTPHTKTFSTMTEENQFVTKDTTVQVTPAQQNLLQFLNKTEVKDIYQSLKTVHYLGTYTTPASMVNLPASAYVHDLLDVLHNLVQENLINNIKNS